MTMVLGFSGSQVRGFRFLGSGSALLLVVLSCLPWAAAAPALAQRAITSSAPKPLSKTDRDTLGKVAGQLREAILYRNVAGILRHVSKPGGLACTDTQIPYRQITSDLQDRNSHLYMSLFDSERFSKECGSEYPADYPAISDGQFFATSGRETMEIAPVKDGWAQVTFKSQTKGRYPREWLFHKEGREWKLTGGFGVSRCSCG